MVRFKPIYGHIVLTIIIIIYFLYFGLEGLYRFEILYLLVAFLLYSFFVDIYKLNKRPSHKPYNQRQTHASHKEKKEEKQLKR